jgi:hypothetical protein
MQTLEQHFRDNPAVFSKFDPDPKSATPFIAPKDTQVYFCVREDRVKSGWNNARKVSWHALHSPT